jgi:HK97 family phage major capsid protein
MSLDKITELRHKAAHQLAEMRRIVDENETLSAEQAAEYDRREADLDEINAQVARMEKLAGIEPTPSFSEGRSLALGERADVEFDDVSAPESRDTAALVDRFLRSKGTDVEARASLLEGSTSAGKEWVPQIWESKLIQSLVLSTKLFDVANVIETSNGQIINIPTQTADEQIALVAEEGLYSNPNPTTGVAALNAYKYGAIVKVSEELLADSAFDISAYIQRQAGRYLGNQIGKVLATGDGSSKPQGINGATVGVTAASATATTSDEVFDVQHSLSAPYRANAAWFVADSWLKNIRKLKTTYGDYILQPGLQAGAPNTLLGSPVYIEQLDAPATGKVPAVYGDPQSYVIRRTPLNITVLRERFADVGDVGFKVTIRVDGRIADTNGLKAFKQA